MDDRRAEPLVLIGVGAYLVFFQAGEWHGVGLVCGTILLCAGAVLDYLHDRNRQP